MVSDSPKDMLSNWATILGREPELLEKLPARDLWFVRAENRRAYVMKLVSPWRNLPIADEARVMQHLLAAGLPVPQFVPTDSASLVAHTGELQAILLPRFEGQPPNLARHPELAEVIGEAIAALHQSLDTYPWPTNSYTESTADALLESLTLPAPTMDLFEPIRSDAVEALRDLPTQVIHGDLNPGNLLVDGNGAVTGMIDFDHLPYAPRIWDLGKFLARVLRSTFHLEKGYALNAIGQLAGSYYRSSHLSSAELRALPYAVLAINLLEASYYREVREGRLQRPMLPDHDEQLESAMAAADWQMSHWDLLTDAISGS